MEDGTSSALGSEKVTGPWDQLGQPVCWQGRNVLDRIGDKWAMLRICLLDGRTSRFMDIRRSLPDISQRMLTVTLRHLERDGIVRRTAYPTVPVTVEHCLTPLGTTLLQSVHAPVRWTVEHEHEIAAARSTYDARLREPIMLQPLDRAGRLSG